MMISTDTLPAAGSSRYVLLAKTTLCTALASFAVTASAQNLDTTATVRAAPVGVTAEVKPLPTVMSTIPGVGVVSAGVEADVFGGAAPFLEFAAINSNLPERLEGAAKDKEDLYPDRLRGGSVDIGSRYYQSAVGHSWYGQGKIGYTEMTGTWEYQDGEIDHRFVSITPGIGLGYRWRWPSRVVVRLGASVAANLIQTQSTENKIDNEDSDTAADKVKDRFDEQALANVDLGLGYMF
jgi:hypothetical protein